MTKKSKKTKSKKKVKAAKIRKPLPEKLPKANIAEAKPQEEAPIHKTKIMAIGIGGGGSSIISEIAPEVKKVDFVAANTDLQALHQTSRECKKFAFGQTVTKGLGCGMDPALGHKSASTARDKIAKLFKGVDLCFFVACLGGGTGSGATPEFIKTASGLNIITVGIFTLPFEFEGSRKMQIAKNALRRITPHLNAFTVIPNSRIFQIIDKKTPLSQAFSAINQQLSKSLTGLIEMLYAHGLINIDFADIRTILEGRGKLSYLNSATAQGANRVEEVTKKVLTNPLIEYGIKGAGRILFNICAGKDLKMKEVEQISDTIANFNKRAKIIFGIVQSGQYQNKLKITLLATGCGEKEYLKKKKATPPPKKPRPKKNTEVKRNGKKRKIPAVKPVKKKKPKAAAQKAGSKSRKIVSRRSDSKIKSKSRKKTKVKVLPEIKTQKTARKASLKSATAVKKMAVPELAKEKPGDQVAELNRRTALDLKKEAEIAEREMLEREKHWDIPAFLKRKSANNQ